MMVAAVVFKSVSWDGSTEEGSDVSGGNGRVSVLEWW